MGIAITVVILVLLWLGMMKLRKFRGNYRNKMEELNAVESIYVSHIEGLPIPQGTATWLYACPDKVVIESKNGNFEVPNDRIINFAALSEEDVKQIEKSVIGRAVVGGILLGGLGAIVGGLSGVGTKGKKVIRHFFIINYTNKDGDTAIVTFENNVNDLKLFADKFSEIIGIAPNKRITL